MQVMVLKDYRPLEYVSSQEDDDSNDSVENINALFSSLESVADDTKTTESKTDTVISQDDDAILETGIDKVQKDILANKNSY